MSFISLEGLNEAKEPELAPEGEYSLMITKADEYDNDKGRTIVKCIIEFTDHDDYARFPHWVALPSKNLDIDNHPEGPTEGKKKFDSLLLSVKRFLHAFDIPFDNGFDVADFVGSSGVLSVSQDMDDDETRVFQVMRIPRMPTED